MEPRERGSRMESVGTGARVVSKEAIKRAAALMTKASARLEHRVVPEGFVRSAKVEKFLADRRSKA